MEQFALGLSILQKYKNVHIIGLSEKPERASHKVASYLQDGGFFELTCVRPNTKNILGIPCYASLEEAGDNIEIVDVFRASQHIPAIVDEAIEAGAKAIWLQEGVTHPEAEEKARQAGLDVISDICIKKVIEQNGGEL
jgi:predicted CoA-binding protein